MTNIERVTAFRDAETVRAEQLAGYVTVEEVAADVLHDGNLLERVDLGAAVVSLVGCKEGRRLVIESATGGAMIIPVEQLGGSTRVL